MTEFKEILQSWVDPSHSIAESNIFLEIQVMGLKPERQFPIGPYFADFYFPEWNLVLEIDGAAFHTGVDNVLRDRERDRYMNNLGYVVIRVTASMSNQNPGGVLSILKYFKGSTRTHFIGSESALLQYYLKFLEYYELLDK